MILTVTLNASIDKAYFLADDYCKGSVNRVAKVNNSAGGKGLNVARVAALCGSEVLATGFAGGHNGRYLLDLLEKDGINSSFVSTEAETRSCINVLSKNNESTEFLEPGNPPTQNEIDKFICAFEELMPQVSLAILSGSLPKGVSSTLYATLVEIAHKHSTKCFVDTSGQALEKALESKPDFVKPNSDEAEQLFGITIHSVKEAIVASKKLFNKGIPNACISLGSKGAVVTSTEGTFYGTVAGVHVVNTVGCGDSFVAGYASQLLLESNTKECLANALAAASANAQSPETGRFDVNDYRGFKKSVEIEECTRS